MPPPTSSDFRLRLTPEQRQAVERLAARKQMSPQEAILHAVEQALAAEADPPPFPEGTPFYGLEDLIAEPGEGPADLSINKAYLDGLGA